MKTVAIYKRVSTKMQDTKLQTADLDEFVKRKKWTVFKVYEDKAVSGTKVKRPALDQLMDDARKAKFDVIVVWKFDRFARSVKHLTEALDEFQLIGIDFVSYTENFDTGNPQGRMMMQLMGVFAEFERNLIRERVQAGVSQKKKELEAKGEHWGRKQTMTDVQVREAKELRLKKKLSFLAIGKKLKLNHMTVFNTLKREGVR